MHYEWLIIRSFCVKLKTKSCRIPLLNQNSVKINELQIWTRLSCIWDIVTPHIRRVFLVWHIVATIFKFNEELMRHVSPREDPFPASVHHESSAIHLCDPYPYEFSYANGQYIFMAEFICWEPRGGQRLITPHRVGPLLSSSSCLSSATMLSIHYGFASDCRGDPINILRMRI